MDSDRTDPAAARNHECQRCGSDEWTWCDYRGCSSCFEPEPEASRPAKGAVVADLVARHERDYLERKIETVRDLRQAARQQCGDDISHIAPERQDDAGALRVGCRPAAGVHRFDCPNAASARVVLKPKPDGGRTFS